MRVYVETNFILEIAFMQDQQGSCDKLLEMCVAGQVALALPAFSIAESYHTLVGRVKKRTELAKELINELNHFSRSTEYKSQSNSYHGLAELMTRSSQDDERRLAIALERIMKVAEVIPLEGAVISEATRDRALRGFAPHDSIIFASVHYHLRSAPRTECCFINRNSRDFKDPAIEEALAPYGCKMLFNFKAGCEYIQHRTTT